LIQIRQDVYRKKIRFLEVRMAALVQHTGMQFNESTSVPIDVHQAVKGGHRLKAIRLFRKIT